MAIESLCVYAYASQCNQSRYFNESDLHASSYDKNLLTANDRRVATNTIVAVILKENL